jgi:hypothetical protein
VIACPAETHPKRDFCVEHSAPAITAGDSALFDDIGVRAVQGADYAALGSVPVSLSHGKRSQTQARD